MDQIEASQEKHLLNLDLTFVLGVKEFLKQDVPQWLTPEKSIQIYSEIKDLTQFLAQEEERGHKKQIDLYGDDDDADVIKYKALDNVCMKY